MFFFSQVCFLESSSMRNPCRLFGEILDSSSQFADLQELKFTSALLTTRSSPMLMNTLRKTKTRTTKKKTVFILSFE